MARARPAVVRLHELEPNQQADFFALLLSRNHHTTRDGKPYYSCHFRDRKRTATFIVWENTPWFGLCQNDWQDGTFYKIRGVYAEHEKYGPQIDIQNLRPVLPEDEKDGFDLADFIDGTRFDPEEMYAQLQEITEQIGCVPLRGLVQKLLERYATPLKTLPATLNKFHPFRGGLLEHTLSVTKKCLTMAREYQAYYSELQPPINVDLLIAGAILHDFGRILEYDEHPVNPQPTVPGRLLGHLFLGRDLVRDAAREQGDVPHELQLLLEHLVICHLNLPEWGSPRQPLIPEALILHHVDDMDAKLEMYVRCLTRDRASGDFTDRDPILNRQLYKGRSV